MNASGKAGVPTPDASQRGVFHSPQHATARNPSAMRRRNLNIDVTSLTILLALAGLPAAALFSQTGGDADTLLFELGREVVVTATRLPLSAAHNPAAGEVYDSERMALLPARSLGDALRQSAGMQLYEYGAAGGLQLMSFRGLGPEYAVVYYNGVRLNSAQNGLADLARLPLLNVDRVEIARGGYGALYGSDALGAVVDVRSGHAPARLLLRAGGGSFGWSAFDLGAGFRSGVLRVGAAASQERARNDFPFHSSRGHLGDFRRANADMLRRAASVDATAAFSGSVIDLSARFVENDIGAPGAFMQEARAGARQRDADLLLSGRYHLKIGAATLLSLASSFSSAREHYKDPSLVFDGVPLESRFYNHSASASCAIRHDFSAATKFLAGLEACAAGLQSADVSGDPERLTAAVFATAETTLPRMPELRVFPSLRLDRISDRPSGQTLTEVSPSLALRAGLMDDAVSLYLRAARGFRAPTFNQLFWRQGGNPDLSPEYSNSFEAGVRAALLGDALETDVALFRHDITDKIVWMPGAGIFWSPRNVRNVRSVGMEAGARGTALPGKLRWRASATWMTARKTNADFAGDATQGKRLAYCPDLTSYASMDAQLTEHFSLGFSARFVGERYNSETNAPESVLDPFAVFDAVAIATIPFFSAEWTVKAEAMNIFDKSYEIIAFYPMPGRSFRVTLSFNLNQDAIK